MIEESKDDSIASEIMGGSDEMLQPRGHDLWSSGTVR